jgi:hypothetical protein
VRKRQRLRRHAEEGGGGRAYGTKSQLCEDENIAQKYGFHGDQFTKDGIATSKRYDYDSIMHYNSFDYYNPDIVNKDLKDPNLYPIARLTNGEKSIMPYLDGGKAGNNWDMSIVPRATWVTHTDFIAPQISDANSDVISFMYPWKTGSTSMAAGFDNVVVGNSTIIMSKVVTPLKALGDLGKHQLWRR